MTRRAVFLDRDGTLIDELGYLGDPAGVRLLPGAVEAVRHLNEAGWKAVVVTNQSGVARGHFDEGAVRAVHERLEALLAAGGAHLDLVLYCPHHPEHGTGALRARCACRKPEPGMLRAAAERLDLDLSSCWTIGDSERDLEAGRRAGLAGGILVTTGKGAAVRASYPPERRATQPVAPDVARAVELVLAGARAPQGR